MKTFYTGGRIVTPDGIKDGVLISIDGKIAEITKNAEIPADAVIYDAAGSYIIPGFIDIHLHGGGGHDFMDGSVEKMLEIARVHCEHGTTAFCPTTVACSKERLFELFKCCKIAKAENKYAQILGIHMEGPYISHAMKGAQTTQFVRDPDIKEAREILEYSEGLLARWSSAPELPNIAEFTKLLHEYCVIPAVAHSNAVCEDIIAAYEKGYRIITHLYSNTPSVRKIGQIVHAGIVEAAYLIDDMNVELIGDGKHVPPELMQMVVKLKGADHIALITDAMRAAGTDATESFLGNPEDNNPVIIEDGVAKLPDRSFFAGSIATEETVFKNAIKYVGLTITEV